MKQMKIVILTLGLVTLTAALGAAQQLYDPQADAHKQVDAAIGEASRTGKNVVLIFGANW